jgi:hypothetical protein
MKAGSGQHFEQRFNAQAAVEVDSRLIVGQRVSQAPNDKQELVPTVKAIPAEVGPLGAVLTDNGFFSERAVSQIEQTGAGAPSGTRVYAPLDKTSHHRTVADLEKKAEPESPPAGASVSEVMRHRLKTGSGKALYKLRQQTVEPVFGIIKSALGFRQFLLRGVQNVSLEWELVCLAYNSLRDDLLFIMNVYDGVAVLYLNGLLENDIIERRLLEGMTSIVPVIDAMKWPSGSRINFDATLKPMPFGN